jgi:hypothetical protein
VKEDRITERYTVRGRPVGYVPGSWGGAFVAVERGEFPISPTGYRSCSGFVRRDVSREEKNALLEQLAVEHEREQKEVLRRLREEPERGASPIMNYVHASLSYEMAIRHGFYSSETMRTALWSGAHRLLCRVDLEPAFQPQPEERFGVWTEGACRKALETARELKRLLVRWAGGDFSEQPSLRLTGISGYFELPERAEPKVELGGYVPEMALGPDTPVRRATTRTSERGPTTQSSGPATGVQLGLF